MGGAGGSSIHSSAVLRRRVKGEEGADDDAYWAAAPRLYDFSKHQLKHEQAPAPPSPLPSPASQAPCGGDGGGYPCLLALQGSGIGWGVRKRVRYVGRHRAARVVDADRRVPPPPVAVVESAVAVHGDEESSSNGKKGHPPEQEEEEEAEESGRDERKVVARPRTEKKRKRKAGRGRRRRTTERPKKIPPEAEEKKKAEESSSQVERQVVSTEKKRKKPEPEPEAVTEESGQDDDERKAVARTETRRKRKTSHGRGRGITDQRPKKNRREEETKRETKPAPKVKVEEGGARARRAMVDRWTARRYAAAEASLLGVLRAFGARAGQPVPRGKLRQEARKLIGDTGLLDHLLKHATDKVSPGSAERLRRRHNADGAMEYWLEPAGLAALRREAGVADPYWVPPPGWKPGDPVSPEACTLEVKRQMEMLATELAGVKRHMEQLMKAHQGTVAIPYQEKYECMVKANGNLEKQVLSLEEKYESATQANGKLEVEVLFLKEYEAVLEKNTRLEDQMAALCNSFLSLKDDLLLLNDGGQEQHMLELEQADLSVKELGRADQQEGHAGKALGNAAMSAGDQLDAGDGTASSSGGGGKRMSRKYSMRICKPQGTFQWPEPDTALLASPASPLTPTAAANLASMDDELHEYMLATGGLLLLPPTPPSASSTNAASAKLLLLPTPASPVQQPPPPPPPATSHRGVDLQASLQPLSGGLDVQLRHTDTSSSSSAAAPCGATAGLLPEGKKATMLGGGVGTELALATPSY